MRPFVLVSSVSGTLSVLRTYVRHSIICWFRFQPHIIVVISYFVQGRFLLAFDFQHWCQCDLGRRDHNTRTTRRMWGEDTEKHPVNAKEATWVRLFISESVYSVQIYLQEVPPTIIFINTVHRCAAERLGAVAILNKHHLPRVVQTVITWDTHSGGDAAGSRDLLVGNDTTDWVSRLLLLQVPQRMISMCVINGRRHSFCGHCLSLCADYPVLHALDGGWGVAAGRWLMQVSLVCCFHFFCWSHRHGIVPLVDAPSVSQRYAASVTLLCVAMLLLQSSPEAL